MQTAVQNDYVTVADYLAAEEAGELSVFRRVAGWRSEKLGGDGATLNLNSLKRSLPLASIHEGI